MASDQILVSQRKTWPVIIRWLLVSVIQRANLIAEKDGIIRAFGRVQI